MADLCAARGQKGGDYLWDAENVLRAHRDLRDRVVPGDSLDQKDRWDPQDLRDLRDPQDLRDLREVWTRWN